MEAAILIGRMGWKIFWICMLTLTSGTSEQLSFYLKIKLNWELVECLSVSVCTSKESKECPCVRIVTFKI
jgi:hypothetical protein